MVKSWEANTPPTREGFPMITVPLPLRTWIRNAAAVFTGRHGAVTDQALQAGCSRQTVYDHARKVEEQLTESPSEIRRLQAENDRLRGELARALPRPAPGLGESHLRHFAVTAQAMGISLRQCEELLGAVLPADAVPDHTTMGRWTAAAARQAAALLKVLDPACASRAETLCLDEIFFGGSRPWWRWSRPAWRCWPAAARATARRPPGRKS